jgi:methionyl-tRNA formyltransferase
MRITLFGQGPLAISVLERLIEEGFEIGLINDSEGTGGDLFKQADKLGIPAGSLHPRRDSDRLLSYIREYGGTDGILLSVNYRFIIEKNVLSEFLWPLNIHGSLLPRYRGRTPHVWAIINGEDFSGATLHLMDDGVDTGPIVLQKKIGIAENETGAMLLRRFADLYPQIIIEGLNFLRGGGLATPQAEDVATYFGKRTPEMGLIDFRLPFQDLRNFIRAQAPPYPGAYNYLLDGSKIVITDISWYESDLPKNIPFFSPRLVNGDILVRTREGVFRLLAYKENGGWK